jgi:hypothetical protein
VKEWNNFEDVSADGTIILSWIGKIRKNMDGIYLANDGLL